MPDYWEEQMGSRDSFLLELSGPFHPACPGTTACCSLASSFELYPHPPAKRDAFSGSVFIWDKLPDRNRCDMLPRREQLGGG